MKKTLSLLVAVLLIISCLPVALAGSGFSATFTVAGGNASITTYNTSDYSSGNENQTTAIARSSSTGEIDETGDGQINFTVIPQSGYEVASVVATAGTYKNLKGPADTGKENTYRLTKVNADTTVTITLQEVAEEPETGDPVITFKNDGVTLSGTKAGITVSENNVTISAAGVYTLTGTCSDGSVTVSKNAGEVTLVLDNLTLSSGSTAPIACKSGTTVTVVAKDGTDNTLTDADRAAASPKSCLNSSGDLTISGSGKLTVNGNNKNGIKADGNLTISDVNLTVNSLDNSISADNILTVNSGKLTITSKEGDCIKAAPDEITDTTKGEIVINGGTLKLTAEKNDAVQAISTLTINGGDFNIVTGGGSSVKYSSSDDGSYKAIKSDTKLVINSGTFIINSADDAIHSNGEVAINGGEFKISTGDDGVHSDTTVTVAGGIVDITTCYEGLEGYDINISGGDINIVSSDDGINISGGKDGSANNSPFGGFGGGMGRPGESTSGGTLTISGGTVVVNATGDGLDSNGNIVISGGTVVVFGPTSNGDGSLDYDGSFEINGGTLLAVGSSGMAQTPSKGSQSVVSSTSVSGKAGTVAIRNTQGEVLLAVDSPKAFSFFCFSSPDVKSDTWYDLVIGAEITGEKNNGVYLDGCTLTGGTSRAYTAKAPSDSGSGFGGFGGNGGMNFLQKIKDFFNRILNFIKSIFNR